MGHMKLVVFLLDDRRYALRLDAVERITRAVEVSPLPKAPGIVMGVINFVGRIVPVLNMRRRFGLPEQKIGVSDQFIIAVTSGRFVALPADSVEGVLEIVDEDIIAALKILPALGYIEGVAKLRNDMIFIHDLGTFLSLEEDEAIGRAVGEVGK